MTTVERVTFAEALRDPDLHTLAEQYAEHAADELRGAKFDLVYYAALDYVPGCTAWMVRDGRGALTGFAVLCIAPRPHSTSLAATVESIFAVSRGSALRRAIEQYAKAQGAAVLLMSAPVGSRASAALVKTGMRVCSSVHIKAL